MQDFYYQTQSTKDFNTTVGVLSQEIEDNKFKILHIHDVQMTLAGKGIEHGPYKIIEFCRAPAAKRVLDADPLIGLFLPCRAVVFEKDGAVTAAVMLPSVISEFFQNADLGDLPKQIEQDIIHVMDKALL